MRSSVGLLYCVCYAVSSFLWLLLLEKEFDVIQYSFHLFYVS